MQEYSLLTDRNIKNLVKDIDRWSVEESLSTSATSMLGLSSGEAILKVLDMRGLHDLQWIGGTFWYNGNKVGKRGHNVQQRALVSWDKIHQIGFWDWTKNETERLAEEWKVPKVAFGLSGRFYNHVDAASLENHSKKRQKGVLYLSKGEVGDEMLLSSSPTKFMLFADTDEKHSDQQLTEMCNGINSPLLIADTQRGEHLICPYVFDGKEFGNAIYEKIYAILLLASLDAQVQLDMRHLAYALFFRERTIRTTEDVNNSPKPIISRFMQPEALLT